jgi:AcrR family transcriptional regulator
VADRPRSTRDRPAKPPLSEDVIVDAALRILRREGLDAVTMRRVATELDTGPASLYVYIGGREELRRAMLGRVAGAVPLEEPDPARWREQVHALLNGWLRAMESHPGIATVALADPPTTEGTLVGAEYLLTLLLAGGVTPEDAAWALDILPLITTAAAVETAVQMERGSSEAETVERLNEAFRNLPADRYPSMARHAGLLTSGTGEERFTYAIEVFLDGLVARAARG